MLILVFLTIIISNILKYTKNILKLSALIQIYKKSFAYINIRYLISEIKKSSFE